MSVRPPRALSRLLSLMLGSGPVARSVLGDLDEEFTERVRSGRGDARRWYTREALAIMARSREIGRRTAPTSPATGPARSGDPLMQRYLDDLREAVRSLRAQPRFLIVASLTLALGVAAVTSIFSVVNGVLLRPLPNPDADRLVNVWSTAPGLGYDQFPISPDLFMFYRRHNTAFEDMALFQRRRANLTESGAPEVVDSAVTTFSYFSTLRVAMSRGRFYSASEDRPEGPLVVVISHRLWSRRYSADPALMGRTVRVDGEPMQVVGVAPAWLDDPRSPDLWFPARFTANPPTGNFGWNAVARLKPHVRVDEATTQLVPLVQRALREIVQSETYRAFLTEGRYRPLVHSMKEDVIGSVREPLLILLGTVGMVLLVACGNVANLCLVRAEARQREMAVRAALGASRGSLVRKLLAEALVLSAVGTTFGVLLSALAVPALLQLAPATIPRLDQVRLDATVLAFAAGAAVLSALILAWRRPSATPVRTCWRRSGTAAVAAPTTQRASGGAACSWSGRPQWPSCSW